MVIRHSAAPKNLITDLLDAKRQAKFNCRSIAAKLGPSEVQECLKSIGFTHLEELDSRPTVPIFVVCLWCAASRRGAIVRAQPKGALKS